jgi:hypothetical protein
MPVGIKELKPKKKMPLPKPKPRHANPKHPMNTEKTKPLGKAVGGYMDMHRQRAMPKPPPPSKGKPRVPKEFMGTRAMESKAADKKRSKRGTAKLAPSTGMAGGGKLKMVEKGGKKVPFYAADGKGKMAMGGMMKKKGYAKGGSVKVGEKGTPKTLSQIAAKNNISLRDLLAANPSIKNANKIRLGQSIKLPSTKMTGSSIGATRNPYKNMSKKDMADMDVKNKSAKRQQAVTKRSRVSAMDELKAKAKAPKALPKLSGTEKADSEETAKQKASRTGSIKSATTAENKRLDKIRAKARGRADRRMGGGKMKKVSGYKSGGMVRGAGAATKGKRFGRCG